MPLARRSFAAISAMLLVAAIASLVIVWPDWSRARAAAAWPTVEGTVVESAVTAGRTGGGGGRQGGRTWGLELLVRYEVDGVTLVVDRESFAEVRSSNRDRYRERAEELAPGTTVTVRHAPDEPGFAVLEPAGSWILPLPAGVFLVVACVFAALARFAKAPPLAAAMLAAAPCGFRLLALALLAFAALAFLGVGGFGVAIGLGRLAALSEAEAWPERDATVVRSEWTFAKHGARIDAKAVVAYRYEVDGVPHESSSRSAVATPEGDARDGNRRVLAHRPGDRVRVRVDPADPTRAALERPSRTLELVALGVAVLFLAMSCGAIFAVAKVTRWWS
jgi:hypothetical protein